MFSDIQRLHCVWLRYLPAFARADFEFHDCRLNHFQLQLETVIEYKAKCRSTL
jgi:hypothetical protein